ncbi:MAG: endoribonuclease MazF [Candidatus Saccharimonadia bacterium]
MVEDYNPGRGDIVWIDFSTPVGHEQSGVRPAIVLSPVSYNAKSGLMVVCPITSKIKGYPFEVELESSKIQGVILADQIKTIDWQKRGVSFADKAKLKVLSQTQALITALLGVDDI